MKKMKLILAALSITALVNSSFAQDGKINEVFADGKATSWKAVTKGATSVVKANKLVITPAVQPDGNYRATLRPVRSPFIQEKSNYRYQV